MRVEIQLSLFSKPNKMKASRKIWKRKTRQHQSRLASKSQVNRCCMCMDRKKHRNEGKSRRWNHPDIQKYLKINKTPDFGRGIQATQSIDVGKIVMSVAPYATAVQNAKNFPYCLTCHAVDVDFISCRRCSVVRFCNMRCRNANVAHRYECGTKFHEITNLDAKCAIQIVFEAMATFENVQDLRRFIRQAFENRNGIPTASHSRAAKLDCILKLQTGEFKSAAEKNEEREIAHHAYQMIATYPKVRAFFQLEHSKKGERILMKLLQHNVSAIVENCFRISLRTKNYRHLDRILLYDILSYLNHACSPNLMNTIEGNVMKCETTQRVQRGEQMFISYRPFDRETQKQRQHKLHNWAFVCHCVRCEYHRDINQMECKRANKMNLKEIKRKLNRPYDWTPQKGAYIIRYMSLMTD